MGNRLNRRRDPGDWSQRREEYQGRESLWRMVPFANRLSAGQRERIDRYCVLNRLHLGDALALLVTAGLDDLTLCGVNGAGLDERRAA